MEIRIIPNDSDVTVYGVAFHGVQDLCDHCTKRLPKDGVYVGADSEHYPCFDASDYAYEKRSYWNFVFARSLDELKRKEEKLENEVKGGSDYIKLTDQTPDDVMPVIYYEGDKRSPLQVPVCLDVSFVEQL